MLDVSLEQPISKLMKLNFKDFYETKTSKKFESNQVGYFFRGRRYTRETERRFGTFNYEVKDKNTIVTNRINCDGSKIIVRFPKSSIESYNFGNKKVFLAKDKYIKVYRQNVCVYDDYAEVLFGKYELSELEKERENIHPEIRRRSDVSNFDYWINMAKKQNKLGCEFDDLIYNWERIPFRLLENKTLNDLYKLNIVRC